MMRALRSIAIYNFCVCVIHARGVQIFSRFELKFQCTVRNKLTYTCLSLCCCFLLLIFFLCASGLWLQATVFDRTAIYFSIEIWHGFSVRKGSLLCVRVFLNSCVSFLCLACSVLSACFFVQRAEKGELIHAAKNGDVKQIEVCLQNRSKIDETDDAGWSPLMFAIANNYKPAAELLIARKANVNHVNKHGAFALYVAAVDGRQELCELLLKSGADKTMKCKANGKTALQMAEEMGNSAAATVIRSWSHSWVWVDRLNVCGWTCAWCDMHLLSLVSSVQERCGTQHFSNESWALYMLRGERFGIANSNEIGPEVNHSSALTVHVSQRYIGSQIDRYTCTSSIHVDRVIDQPRA